MDIVQIKQIRKSIRQNNLDKKVFLGFVQDYTNSIYNQKPRSQKKIDEAIQLILDRGVLPDGANELRAAVTFNGLKNLVENDFTMFVRAFQILFKFAGSLAVGSGKDKVMYFANQLKDKIEFKMIVTVVRLNPKKINSRSRKEQMDTALKLHQLLPQCNVLLTKSNDCVERLDEIIKEIKEIKHTLIEKELKKVKEIDYETLGPDSQDMLDAYELVKYD
eukprot:SAG22_NODE_18_length_32591_cov_38.043549_12_plen_219_part_00